MPVKDAEVSTGGLPPVALGEVSEPTAWFSGYEQAYFERDLRDIASVENVLGFRDLMKLAALRTAQILNIASLARDARAWKRKPPRDTWDGWRPLTLSGGSSHTSETRQAV